MPFATLTGEFRLDDLRFEFEALVRKIQAVRDKLSRPDSDARNVLLSGMQLVISGFAATVRSISRNRTVDQVRDSFDGYVEGRSVDDVIHLASEQWKLSVLTLFHFKLDSLFQDILSALGRNPGTTGFGRNMIALTDAVTLGDKLRARAVLRTPTCLRNSIHNNGIHRADDFTIELHGLMYEFLKDRDVQCASFGHILAALDASVGVVEEILLSPEVNAVPAMENLFVALNPP